jgi:hypothetical protein
MGLTAVMVTAATGIPRAVAVVVTKAVWKLNEELRATVTPESNCRSKYMIG